MRRIYVRSPLVDIDPLWEVVKKYSREVLGVNQDEEKTFFSEFNAADLQEVYQHTGGSSRLHQEAERLTLQEASAPKRPIGLRRPSRYS